MHRAIDPWCWSCQVSRELSLSECAGARLGYWVTSAVLLGPLRRRRLRTTRMSTMAAPAMKPSLAYSSARPANQITNGTADTARAIVSAFRSGRGRT